MNITIDQLLAKIGSLSIQNDLLVAENTMLKNTIKENASKEIKEPKENS